MGILVGLVSAACFGLSMVLIRLGMRSRPHDNGHFMSVLTNVVVLGAVVSVVGFDGWTTEGALAFVAAGLLTTFVGRGLSMQAIRLIGPARQGIFLMGAPLVAAAVGAIFLGETVAPGQAIGGLLIMGGLVWVVVSQNPARPAVVEAEMVSVPQASRSFRQRGYALSILAVFAFGIGFVFSKWGVSQYPSPVVAAFIGASTALAAILAQAVVTGSQTQLVQDNLRSFPVFFAMSGALTALGLLSRYWAFLTLPAWMVSVLTGTQALWTVFWSWVLLRNDDVITKHVIAAVLVVTTGVVILTLQQPG